MRNIGTWKVLTALVIHSTIENSLRAPHSHLGLEGWIEAISYDELTKIGGEGVEICHVTGFSKLPP
jgi:hypothetical protein